LIHGIPSDTVLYNEARKQREGKALANILVREEKKKRKNSPSGTVLVEYPPYTGGGEDQPESPLSLREEEREGRSM